MPFSNAILNVKELGGKKHTPNMTRKQPDFHFPPIVNLFRAKALLSNGIFRIQCLKKALFDKTLQRSQIGIICNVWFLIFFSTCSDLTYKHICFFCSSSITFLVEESHSCADVRPVNVFRGGCINCTPPFLENVEHSSKL